MAFSFGTPIQSTLKDSVLADTPTVNSQIVGSGAAVGCASSTLAVVLYEAPEGNEVRCRGFHPGTGAVYYDDNLWVGYYSNCWLQGSDTGHVFGVLYNTIGSTGSGTVYVFSANTTGWLAVTYSATGLPEVPQTDGTPGTGYFYMNIGTNADADAIWTFDLTTMARTVTPVTVPTGISNIVISTGQAFRGGWAVLGRGTTNGGTVGHLYWATPASGGTFVDYTVSGLSVAANIDEAAGTVLVATGPSSSDIRINYDPGADTFAVVPYGYRDHSDSDLSGGAVDWGNYEQRIDPTTLTLARGIVLYGPEFDESGMTDPYGWRLYVTGPDGSYAIYDVHHAAAWGPDLVDFNTFLDFQVTSFDVAGSSFAAVLGGYAGFYDADADVQYWQTLDLLVSGGAAPGGWQVGIGWADAGVAITALSGTSFTDDFERSDLGPNWAEDGPLLGSGGARAASFLADGAYQSADNDSEGVGVEAAASIRRTTDAGTDQFIEAEVGNFFQGHDPDLDEVLQWVTGKVYLFAQLAPGSLAGIAAVAYIEAGDGAGEAYMEFILMEADGSFGGFFGGGGVSPLTGWQSNPNYVIRLEVTAVGHCRAFFEGELLTEADVPPTGGHNVGIGMNWDLTNSGVGTPNPGTSLRFEWVTGSAVTPAVAGGWSVG